MSSALTKELPDEELDVFLSDAHADQPLLTLSELAARYHTKPRLIRAYETRGLLRPIILGTARWYDRDAQDRLKQIEAARKLGLTYGEISALVGTASGPPQRAEIIRTIGDQILQLEREHRQIERTLIRLRQQYYIVTDPDLDGS